MNLTKGVDEFKEPETKLDNSDAFTVSNVYSKVISEKKSEDCEENENSEEVRSSLSPKYKTIYFFIFIHIHRITRTGLSTMMSRAGTSSEIQ